MKKDSQEDTPKIIKKNLVHEGFLDVYLATIQLQKEICTDYTIVSTKAKASAVLAQDICGRYLVIKEYRYPMESWIYSLPGGRVEPNEDSIEGAKREFLEETGYTASDFRTLFTHNPMPAVSNQKVDVFYAKNCEFTQTAKLDRAERIVCMLLKEKELLTLLEKNSTHVDSILSSALFYLLLSRKAW